MLRSLVEFWVQTFGGDKKIARGAKSFLKKYESYHLIPRL